jgi:hypothetical protein
MNSQKKTTLLQKWHSKYDNYMNNAKLIAYCPCHYGKPFLKEAIQSVEPFVERIIILYSAEPSYGFGTHTHCPDSEQELHDIAVNASPKVEWYKIAVGTEGDHRAYIYNFTDGYDGILAFDADEVFDQNDLPNAIDLAMKSDKRYIGFAGFINFWKSFNWACYDGFTPIRFINLHNPAGEGVVPCKVYHFSTAQDSELIKYKLLVHGHKDEIRTNWFSDIYMKWEPGMEIENGVHLVAFGIWVPIFFDKITLPESLKQHPYYNLDVIP